MATITLELTDELAASLTEEAERLGLTLQELALWKLVTPTDEERNRVGFEEATDYVLQKNAELYERLANRKERVSQAISRIVSKNEELYRRLA